MAQSIQSIPHEDRFSPSEGFSSPHKENDMSATTAETGFHAPATRASQQATAVASTAKARLKAAKKTALERAIAKAEAFLPQFQQVSREVSEAATALEGIKGPSYDERMAARALVLMPNELSIARDPAEAIVRITMEYGDGTIRETIPSDTNYRPFSRKELEEFCGCHGLDTPRYLALWDEWQEAQLAAENGLRTPEFAAAQERYEAAEKAYDATLDQMGRLAHKILGVAVSTPEDALIQMDAYSRVLEAAEMYDPLSEHDQHRLHQAAINALRAAAESARELKAA